MTHSTDSYTVVVPEPDDLDSRLRSILGELPGVDGFVREVSTIARHHISGRGLASVLVLAFDSWAPSTEPEAQEVKQRLALRLVHVLVDNLPARGEALRAVVHQDFYWTKDIGYHA